MKIRKVKYQIVQATKDTFRVCRTTSYFGFDWISEFIGDEYYTISDARSFISICTNNNIEIKLY